MTIQHSTAFNLERTIKKRAFPSVRSIARDRSIGAGETATECPCIHERLKRDIYTRDAIERGVAAREPVGQRFCVHLQLTGLSADCARRNRRRTRVLRYLLVLPVACFFFLRNFRESLLRRN